MVGNYIYTMKTTFLFKLFFKIQVYKKTIRETHNWQLLFVSMFMLIHSVSKQLIEIKIEIESCLHCINIFDDESTSHTK